jgi:hypothetical protein
MSEPIAAEIRIGGLICRSLVPKLIDVIDKQGVSVSWEEDPFDAKTAEELLELARDKDGKPGHLSLIDLEANWGQFEGLEEFLVQQGIAFDRYSEAKHQYDAERVWFRPGMRDPETIITDGSHNPIVGLTVLEEYDHLLADGKIDVVRQSIAEMRHYMCPPDLLPLSIVADNAPQSAGCVMTRLTSAG